MNITNFSTETVLPPSPQSAQWSLKRVLFILVPLFFLLVYPLGLWPNFGEPNQTSRAFLTLSLYERGDTIVDTEVKKYWELEDLSYYKGHYFSNKVPGSSFWLLIFTPLIDLLTPGNLTLAQLLYFGHILALVVPFSVFLYFLGRALEKIVSPGAAWGLVLTYALGTNSAMYTTVYFSHTLVAMAHASAFLMILSRNPKKYLLAGIFSGFGVATELPTFVILIALTVFSLFYSNKTERWKCVCLFMLGALPLLMGLIIYNWASFDNPLTMAYRYEIHPLSKYVSSKPYYGLTVPDFQALYGLLFSPSRGLFFLSPWLWGSFLAIFFWKKYSTDEKLCLAVCLTAASFLVLFISTYYAWHGGFSFGSRYITACYPFLLFAVALFLRQLNVERHPFLLIMFGGACTLAIIVHAIGFTCFPFSPWVDISCNPISVFIWPFIKMGHGTHTMATYLGASVSISFTLFLVLELMVFIGYLVPLIRGLSWSQRRVFVASACLGLAAFFVWFKIGSAETAERRDARDWLMKGFLYHDGRHADRTKLAGGK